MHPLWKQEGEEELPGRNRKVPPQPCTSVHGVAGAHGDAAGINNKCCSTQSRSRVRPPSLRKEAVKKTAKTFMGAELCLNYSFLYQESKTAAQDVPTCDYRLFLYRLFHFSRLFPDLYRGWQMCPAAVCFVTVYFKTESFGPVCLHSQPWVSEPRHPPPHPPTPPHPPRGRPSLHSQAHI